MYKATKVGPTGEYSEEIPYSKIQEMMLSGGFMQMLKRMQIGEELFYNEKNIGFKRIK